MDLDVKQLQKVGAHEVECLVQTLREIHQAVHVLSVRPYGHEQGQVHEHLSCLVAY